MAIRIMAALLVILWDLMIISLVALAMVHIFDWGMETAFIFGAVIQCRTPRKLER